MTTPMFGTETDVMAAMANRMRDNSGQIAVELDGLINRAGAIVMQGRAGTAFTGVMEEWRQHATRIKALLDSIEERIRRAGGTYDSANTTSQSGFQSLAGTTTTPTEL